MAGWLRVSKTGAEAESGSENVIERTCLRYSCVGRCRCRELDCLFAG